MRAYLKSSRFIAILILILLFLRQSSQVYAQSESEAQISIQQAEGKLIEVVKSLEAASETNIVLIDLVQETDAARIKIVEAITQFRVGNYTQAFQTANDAKEELDNVALKIDQRLSQKKQNSRILFSVLGVSAALFTIVFSLIFVIKIYPWFKAKQLDEYGKLEIKYETDKERGEDK